MNQWTQAGGPEGGRVSSIVAKPLSQTLYAGTWYRGGISKSTNGGGAWALQDLGNTGIMGVTSMALDPRDPSILYLGAMSWGSNGGGLYVLRDNQGSWSTLAHPGGVVQPYTIATDPQQGGTVIYAGGYAGISKSMDGGATWNTTYLGYDPDTGDDIICKSIAVDQTPDVPDAQRIVLYAKEYGGVFRSADGGRNWTPVDNVPASVVAMTGSTVVAGGVGTIYKNTSKGEGAWTTIALAPEARVDSVVIDPADPSTVYASTSKGLYKVVLGATDTATLVDPALGMVFAVSQEDAQTSTVYARSSRNFAGGIVKSTNGGAWVPSNSGLINTYVYGLAQDPLNANTIYAGLMYGGVYKSEDKGATFLPMNEGLPADETMHVVALKALAPTPNGEPLLLAGAYDGAYRYVNDSTDPLVPHWTWKQQALPSLGYVHGFAEAPYDAVSNTRRIFAATEHGAFMSTDGGNVWNLVSPPDYGFSDIVMAPDGKLFAAGYRGDWDTIESGVFRGELVNGNWTWVNVTAPLGNYLSVSRLSLAVDASGYTIYAGPSYYSSSAATYVSRDNGTTWSNLPTYVGTPAIDPTSPATLYASDETRRSKDSGATWNAYGTGFNDKDFVVTPLLVDSTGTTIYAGTYGIGVWSITLGTTISSSSPALDFGSVYVGRPATQSVTISNTGTDNAAFKSIAINGLNKDQFSLSGSCLGKAYLKGGESCELVVAFAPAAKGVQTASLDLSYNATAGTSLQIPLSGNGAMAHLDLGVTGNGTIQVGGNSCPLLCSYDYPYGTAVTVSALANQDSVFAGWTGCDSSTENCTIIMDSDKVVSAGFQVKTFPLTATAVNFGGTITPNEAVATYGSSQTFTITTNPGYKLASLTDNGVLVAATNSYTVTNITSPHAIVASFIQATLTGINAMATDTTAHGPDGRETIYAGTKRGLFRSATGGEVWEPVTTNGLPNLNIGAIAIDTATAPATVYVATQAGIFSMTTDGTAWSVVSTDNSVKTLTIDKGAVPHTLYAGTNGGILVIKR